jgi:hypothetical protein
MVIGRNLTPRQEKTIGLQIGTGGDQAGGLMKRGRPRGGRRANAQSGNVCEEGGSSPVPPVFTGVGRPGRWYRNAAKARYSLKKRRFVYVRKRRGCRDWTGRYVSKGARKIE